MPKEQLPELPKEWGRYIDRPYGGLFGDNTQIKIIEEVIADPNRNYRPRYFEELTGASAQSIRKALNNLTNLGLIKKRPEDNGLKKTRQLNRTDIQNYIYNANLKSKKFVALTFLSFASIDDRGGTECMDFAILDYYFKVFTESYRATSNRNKIED